MTFFCNQIINQYTNISMRAVNDNPFFSLKFSRRIDPRDQPLR